MERICSSAQLSTAAAAVVVVVVTAERRAVVTDWAVAAVVYRWQSTWPLSPTSAQLWPATAAPAVLVAADCRRSTCSVGPISQQMLAGRVSVEKMLSVCHLEPRTACSFASVMLADDVLEMVLAVDALKKKAIDHPFRNSLLVKVWIYIVVVVTEVAAVLVSLVELTVQELLAYLLSHYNPLKNAAVVVA